VVFVSFYLSIIFYQAKIKMNDRIVLMKTKNIYFHGSKSKLKLVKK